MKPVIIIDNYYQEIHITLGQAIHSLLEAHKDLQVETLVWKFNRCCESHAQCMDVISQFVDIVSRQEA